MKMRAKNKKAMFRVLFDLKINHFNGKKEIVIKELTSLGFCLKYAVSDTDVNVEEILKQEISNNPNVLLDHLQIMEEATFEMTGKFLCTAMFHPETHEYVRSNWKLDDVVTYLLEQDDLDQLSIINKKNQILTK